MSLLQSKLDVPPQATTRGPAASIDWQAELATHRHWLRTVVVARLGEPQAADEVLQEVALAALRGSDKLINADKVAPWLYRLSVTQALLYRRKHGRRRKLVQGFASRYRPTEVDSRESDPLTWLLADERRKLVRESLGKLSSRDAEILLLKYTEDWSYHELAGHLGISHSAVETRLHRARERLRGELAALEVNEVPV